jgi:hypothetical protein
MNPETDIIRLFKPGIKMTVEDMFLLLPYNFYEIEQATIELVRRKILLKENYLPIINTSDDGAIWQYFFLNNDR